MNEPEQTPRRQLALSLRVAFSPPANGALARLDDWLNGVLDIHVAPITAGGAQAWLWRVLILAREWMLIGRIPVFDPPAIDALAPDPDRPGNWNATVRLPLVDNIATSLYSEVVGRALHICAWAAANPPNGENRNKLFAAITSFADERLARAASRGKSTMPVLQAAHQIGIPFIHIGGGIFQLGWGRNARRIDRSVTGQDSAIGSNIAQNKALTAMLLRDAGLPTPVHGLAATADQALAAARRLGWPVVVKPAALDRGEGVTTDVADEATLRRAHETALSAIAARPSHGCQVIIERQAPGICDRLFVAHGALLYAVRRWPMGVRGDGVHTVAALVANEVAADQRLPPWKRSEIQPIDEAALRAIAAAGLSPDAVPAKGAAVLLRNMETAEASGLPEDVTGAVHPENAAIAVRAAALLGLEVAGIDFISTDIGKPWHETGGIINEVNFSPMLGASEISRRKIPVFLNRVMGGNGRIPVHLFLGGEAAWREATQYWRKLVSGGVAAYLTSFQQTIAPSGAPWRMPFDNIAARARALLLSPQAGAIVLAARPEELQQSPLPFDAVDTLIRAADTRAACHDAA